MITTTLFPSEMEMSRGSKVSGVTGSFEGWLARVSVFQNVRVDNILVLDRSNF